MAISAPEHDERTGILGGSFNPVHNGHMTVARRVLQHFALSQVRLLPLCQPVHRPSFGDVSAEQRLDMLRLAVQGEAGLSVDDREVVRGGVSYSIDTLRSLRQELPQHTLIWILGADAAAVLDTWREWQRLLDYAHILVVTRNGNFSCSTKLAAWMQQHTVAVARFPQGLNGSMASFTIDPVAVSSSQIRQCRQAGLSLADWLPPAVNSYILQKGLYQHG